LITGRQGEVRRHHADHRSALAVQRDLPADQPLVAAKSALPERMAHHHDWRASDFVLFRQEDAPAQRPHPQHCEKVGGDCRDLQPRRLIFAGKNHSTVKAGGQLLERLALRPPVGEVGI
jgi:hypothetical protein